MSDEQRKLIAQKIQRAMEHRHVAASPATKINPVGSNTFNDFASIDEQQREAMLHEAEERKKAKQHQQQIRKRLLSMAGKEVDIDETWPFNDRLMERATRPGIVSRLM